MTFEDVIDNIRFSYIDTSAIHGYGLFADRDIKVSTVLGTLDGQVVPWDLHEKLNLTFEWNAWSRTTLLVRPYRTKYSYINHHRQPNLEIVHNDFSIVVLKNIKKDDEMTIDYRKEPLSQEYIDSTGKYYL